MNMDDVNSVQVTGIEEGERLITYLSDIEVWVTPFVLSQGNSYYVKAAIPLWELYRALLYIREVY